ncbi:MAG: hypothetical protein KDA89_12960 [Planctomycetaceae bacterium]|nr:hypothetical protein [Planctomycetaceae bacterium]
MEESPVPTGLSTVAIQITEGRTADIRMRRSVRHALVVLRRAERSAHRRDQELQEGIRRAIRVMTATRATVSTSIFSFHCGDILSRLAGRIVRLRQRGSRS